MPDLECVTPGPECHSTHTPSNRFYKCKVFTSTLFFNSPPFQWFFGPNCFFFVPTAATESRCGAEDDTCTPASLGCGVAVVPAGKRPCLNFFLPLKALITLLCSPADMWSVAGTGPACIVDGACVQTPNYPSGYSIDGVAENCTITSLVEGGLDFLDFDTFSGPGLDRLFIDGNEYLGASTRCASVGVDSLLQWNTRGGFAQTAKKGWKVCLRAAVRNNE